MKKIEKEKKIQKLEKQFYELETEIIQKMADNQMVYIAPDRLLLDKTGNWHGKFDMSGYTIGKSDISLEYILREYIPEDIIMDFYESENDENKIKRYVKSRKIELLKELIKDMEAALNSLNEI